MPSTGTGGIRAGRAYVEFFTEDSKLVRGLRSAEKMFAATAKRLIHTGVATTALGTAITAPIAASFKQAVAKGDDLSQQAKLLRTNVETLDSYRHAAVQAGEDGDKFLQGLTHLNRVIAEASDGAGQADEDFYRLGLDFRKLYNLPIEDKFTAIADAIAGISDPVDKARIAEKFFGEDLPQALAKGGKALKTVADEAKKNGLVMTQADADNANKVTKSLNAAYDGLKTAVMAVGAALLPQADVIKKYASSFQGAVQSVKRFLDGNRDIVTNAVKVGAGMTVAGIALTGFGVSLALVGRSVGLLIVSIKALGTAVKVLQTVLSVGAAFGVLKSVIVALVSPMGLLVIGITAAAAALAYFYSQSDEGKQKLAQIESYFTESGENIKTAWEGVKNALEAGDISAAWKVVCGLLNLEFQRAINEVQKGWETFREMFVGGWHDSVYLIQSAWTDATADISNATLDMLAKGKKDFREYTDSILNMWAKVEDILGTGLGDSFRDLAKAAPEDVKKITDALKKENEKQRNDEKNRLSKVNQEEQQDRDKAAADRLQKAQAAVDIAKAEMGKAVEEAKNAVDKKRPKDFENQGKDLGPAGSPITGSRGTFASSALQQIFAPVNDWNKRVLTAVEENVKGVEKVAMNTEKMLGQLEKLPEAIKSVGEIQSA